ncbi:MAG: hypothetical protein GF320_18685, partial [Armatimonadia bacterium]|nr:hypothetical protein [Armatimonadia bacterium]
MLSMALIAFVSAAYGAVPFVPTQAPDAITRVVLFEDNVLHPDTAHTSLVYRYVGQGIQRQPRLGSGAIILDGGPASLIHPAQYDRATFEVRLLVGSGPISLAVGHNGMRDVHGRHVERPGVQVIFGESSTQVVDLATGHILARGDAVLPRGRPVEVGVAWDRAEDSLRIDLPQGSYTAELPRGLIAPGGVAVRTEEDTRARLRRLRVIWEDARPVVLYDGYHTVYDLAGRALGRIPPPDLPSGATRYTTTAIDLARDRSLIAFGGPDFNPILHDTIEGFAVRHLPTGRLLATWGSPLNGCLPLQGGGGFDGLWLLQDWVPPGSLCWVDWDAFDRGDLGGFVQPSHSGHRDGDTFVGYHDPTNAIGGSLARYLRITESWRGVNHLMVHPDLRPFVGRGDVALPEPPGELVSHTGPGGLPSQLAVRDRGRA